MKKIKFSGNMLDFTFNDEAKCWISIINIDGIEIEFEIDMEFYNQDEVDWEHLEQFLNYISAKNRLSEFIKNGIRPIKEIGIAFFQKCIDEIKGWEMKFSKSIIFRGHPKDVNLKKDFEFSLVYHFVEEKVNGSLDGDAYGLFLVDIISCEGIYGARRIQC